MAPFSIRKESKLLIFYNYLIAMKLIISQRYFILDKGESNLPKIWVNNGKIEQNRYCQHNSFWLNEVKIRDKEWNNHNELRQTDWEDSFVESWSNLEVSNLDRGGKQESVIKILKLYLSWNQLENK